MVSQRVYSISTIARFTVTQDLKKYSSTFLLTSISQCWFLKSKCTILVIILFVFHSPLSMQYTVVPPSANVGERMSMHAWLFINSSLHGIFACASCSHTAHMQWRLLAYTIHRIMKGCMNSLKSACSLLSINCIIPVRFVQSPLK